MSNGHDKSYEAGADREIRVKSIAITGFVLAVIIVASAAAAWWLSKGLRSSLKDADPAPPVLQEAQIQEPPPEPRLQTSPEEDMRQMRAQESAALDGYAWVDEAGGIARVPIERAMEMVADQEVPMTEPATEASPEAAPEPATETESEGQ